MGGLCVSQALFAFLTAQQGPRDLETRGAASSDGKLEEERSPVLQVRPEIVGVLQEADSPHENGLTHNVHSLPLWKSHSQRGAGKASLLDGCLLHEGQPLAGIVLHNPYTNRIF